MQQKTQTALVLERAYLQGFADAVNSVHLKEIILQSDEVFNCYLELSKDIWLLCGVTEEMVENEVNALLKAREAQLKEKGLDSA